jgi:DNA-binding transcriptional regulator YdaS (Cro superfamily)
MNAITKAISLRGLLPLANELGVTYQAVRKWERSGVPAERVLPIEVATDHLISRHELRPDLYPRADWCRCPACEKERVKDRSEFSISLMTEEL